MKPFALLAVAVLAGGGSAAFAASSTDRTSMPDNCTDRNVTCVIQDGGDNVIHTAPPDRRDQLGPKVDRDGDGRPDVGGGPGRPTQLPASGRGR
jgi:hypothetical protein